MDFAAKNRLPAMYANQEYMDVGGLMSYGPNLAEMFCRAATYVDRILKGAKPGDLPIEQPTKFDLVVNLKTANALGADHSPVAAVAGRSGDPVRRPGRARSCRGRPTVVVLPVRLLPGDRPCVLPARAR
ncbi:MAG: ABC transporter substrate binding protein [Candidatus Rokuibacteriota bacterium]